MDSLHMVRHDQQSDIRDGMRIDWNVPIEMDDGIVLRADVFRPVLDERYPPILSCGPYGRPGTGGPASVGQELGPAQQSARSSGSGLQRRGHHPHRREHSVGAVPAGHPSGLNAGYQSIRLLPPLLEVPTMHASNAFDQPYTFGRLPRVGSTHPYLRQHEVVRLLVLRGRPDIEARRMALHYWPLVLQARLRGQHHTS